MVVRPLSYLKEIENNIAVTKKTIKKINNKNQTLSASLGLCVCVCEGVWRACVRVCVCVSVPTLN